LFDAFMSWYRANAGWGHSGDAGYYRKHLDQEFTWGQNVRISLADGQSPARGSLYIRTAYRNDPEFAISGSRARHYAFQALRTVFPDINKAYLANACGCAGNPRHYAVNSTNSMQRFVGGPHRGERRHRFWNEDIFDKVIAAVRVLEGTAAPQPEPEPERSDIAAPSAPPARPFISERQAKAYRELEQAMAKTARLRTE
jgi:hypothetical protein